MTMLRYILIAVTSFLAPELANADTIAIIGTGGVGSALGPHFAAAGHAVV
jgi:hypothetical protein